MPPSATDDADLIVRLDAGEPPLSAAEAAARAPYERVLARLRDLPEIEPAPGWEERALALFHAETLIDPGAGGHW